METDAPQMHDVKTRTLMGRIAAALLPSALAVVVMGAAYLAIPEPTGSESPALLVIFGIAMLIVYAFLTSWAVIRLQRSRHPAIEGVLVLVVMATLLILAFAYTYMAIAANDHDSFTQPLSKTSAVYFTVTILSTVGFGDITPVTDLARIVVTTQMIVGVTLLSVGVRVVVQSARTGTARTRVAQQLEEPPSQ